MNNEVTLEELDKNLRQTTKMASDNEQKLDELSRKLGVQEEELKRAIERAELAENKLKGIEEELQMVGDNMKQLEMSAEKAVEREENVGQDDQEQEDCRRVLKSQTKGFREHDRKTGKELLLISLKIIVWIKY